MNTIKVFFNLQHLLITTTRPGDSTSYKTIIESEEEVFNFRKNPKQLYNEKHDSNILIITPAVEETLESLFDYAQPVIAAGGIIKNEKNETLIIFRRGYWDMPKGKVDKGEKIINAAQREVWEETGVEIATVQEDAKLSYHCYKLKGKDSIKETHWYHMTARDGQTKLKPQAAEGIEHAVWATDFDIKTLEKKFYPMIWDILSHLA